MEWLPEALTLAVTVGLWLFVWRLSRRVSRQWLEETFGHLRARREAHEETYDVADVMEEASKWL